MQSVIKNQCVVVQVHIPPFDPIGELNADQKRQIVKLSIQHFRKWNPETYIILIGHGELPDRSTVELCDYFSWEPLREMTPKGLVRDMPAQFVFVSKGIKHARQLGFTHCLKTRGDSLIGRPHIIDECHRIISDEGTKILLTQFTGPANYRMGDCFMYGEIDLLDGIWDMEGPVLFEGDGEINTGMRFVMHLIGSPPPPFDPSTKLYKHLNWDLLVRKVASYRDVYWIQFIDLRREYHNLHRWPWSKDLSRLLDGSYPSHKVLWGRRNKWCVFDRQGRVVRADHRPCFFESSFYLERLEDSRHQAFKNLASTGRTSI